MLGWGIFTWHVIHFQADVLFFKGLKRGLGKVLMETLDERLLSPSVVIAGWEIYAWFRR